MKTRICSVEEYAAEISECIADTIKTGNKVNIGFGADESVFKVLEALGQLIKDKKTDITNVCCFTVHEYDSENGILSLCSEINKHLGLPEMKIIGISKENYSDYDEMIDRRGGLDILLLGIGNNASIGFNESGTPFNSLCHRQKLTKSTKSEHSLKFGSVENIPEYGVTMGISTIMKARQIYLVAAGKDKADAVFKMLYSRTDSTVSGAFIQLHSQIIAYLDTASAENI